MEKIIKVEFNLNTIWTAYSYIQWYKEQEKLKVFVGRQEKKDAIINIIEKLLAQEDDQIYYSFDPEEVYDYYIDEINDNLQNLF